jgi:pimeloyl-ACP methyl ester carboxylesterase
MISGSGQQDRDETLTPISNFKPFAVLADSLTNDGLATFRYDDRGVGQSTGNFDNATLDMLASDVEAITREVRTMPDHKFEQIILLGHSQGGMVAGKLAAESSAIDKVILMASTGVPLKEVLRFQVKQAFAGSDIDSALIEQEVAAREQLMQAIREQKNIPQAKETYQQRIKTIQLAAGADSTQASSMAKQQAEQLTTNFSSPQMQSLLFYNPVEDLAKLDTAVLVLFGGKDTQVPVEINKEPIKKALETADVDYKIEVFESANHLFQEANTGSVQEYSSLKEQFIDEFTSTISNWIIKE